jgi:hypothetical protein
LPGAQQWSFAMKKKTSPKDLTPWVLLAGAVFKAVSELIDLLSKVVNYASRVSKFRIQLQEF